LRSPESRLRANSRTAAVSLAALILYPLAVTLPILEVSKLGHLRETGILEGTARLLADGHLAVGLVVLVCSVLLPVMKLISLLLLSSGTAFLGRRHRAFTYQVVEWTGRFGMLDVLLVAILVAVLKLGDVVTVRPGPGVLAFSACVLLSLLASALFDPHALWEERS
jgi:paraquat-inducible protein A